MILVLYPIISSAALLIGTLSEIYISSQYLQNREISWHKKSEQAFGEIVFSQSGSHGLNIITNDPLRATLYSSEFFNIVGSATELKPHQKEIQNQIVYLLDEKEIAELTISDGGVLIANKNLKIHRLKILDGTSIILGFSTIYIDEIVGDGEIYIAGLSEAPTISAISPTVEILKLPPVNKFLTKKLLLSVQRNLNYSE